WYMNSSLSKHMIKSFIEENKIDMSQYIDKGFTSYNDFFTRKIIEGKSPFLVNDNVLISPADSKLSCYRIDDDSCFLIKNTLYSLSDLLDNDISAKEYLNGY